MKLSPTLEAAFNAQILMEFESVYAYLQMAADLDHANWPGFAAWMHLQSQEEWMHATKFTDFVLQRGGRVKLEPLAAPQSDLSVPLTAFEHALGHEQRVSASISALYGQALGESDFASLPLLQWFVNEQVEEEDSVGRIVERMRAVGTDTTGLMILDRELAARRPVSSLGAPA